MLLAYKLQMHSSARTCPPGPELLEKDSSTAARWMLSLLKRAIHPRASLVSLGVVRAESRGAIGRVPKELFDAERANTVLVEAKFSNCGCFRCRNMLLSISKYGLRTNAKQRNG